MKLKKLNEQTIVITGASSGIGLATARLAAKRGARVVAAARNEDALRDLCDEIRSKGGQCHYVVADVGEEQDVRRISAGAVGHFGSFDTWVNNAGVSVYGRILDTPIEDAKRIFETNFWGLAHGSRIALNHLRHNGGALINVGSVVSDTAIPLQGFYSASKHAVKGFTDALRMECEAERIPVSITLIKPAAIDTPYTQHAGNYLGEKPQHAPPVYDPRVVAETILHAAEHPERDLFAGGGAKFMSTLGRYAPVTTDKYLESVVLPGTRSGKPIDAPHDGVHHASFGGQERGDYEGIVRKTSVYTNAAMHPVLASAVGLGMAFALGSLMGVGPLAASKEVRD